MNAAGEVDTDNVVVHAAELDQEEEEQEQRDEHLAGGTPHAQKKRQVFIRKLETGERVFWDSSCLKELLPVGTVVDQSPDGNRRDLPENELAAMALNEVAARRGRGFFLHLRNRDFWKKLAGVRPGPSAPGGKREGGAGGEGRGQEQHETQAELWPPSRTPRQPRADYPDMLYMNFVWDEGDRAGFQAASQRSRYLKCDGLINPPAAQTPLYPIQYATHAYYPLHATERESLVVLSTPEGFYLATTSDLEGIIGRWPRGKRRPAGSDPDSRLDTAPYIWMGPKKPKDGIALERLEPFEVRNVEALYDSIVSNCRAGGVAATLTPRRLKDLIPRPLLPGPGLALGTNLRPARQQQSQSADDSSNPPCQRGVRRQRARGNAAPRGGRVGAGAAGGSTREPAPSTRDVSNSGR